MKTLSIERGYRPILLALALALRTGSALAQPVLTDAAKQEARQRFDAGLDAYDAGDFEGALAEFQRAYELTSHPLVLYNIGLVQARRDEPVASVAALQRLLESENTGLDEARLSIARTTLQEQSRKLGLLEIRTNVDGARLQIDGLDVTGAPGQAVQVRAGVHRVSVLAPGFAPSHRQVTVAHGLVQRLTLSLEPLDEALAHLTLTTNVSDAAVIVNGTTVGMTPLPTSLSFRAGHYQLRLARSGYQPVERSLNLQPGSEGTLSLPLGVNPAATRDQFGRLKLDVSESNAVILLDGAPALAPGEGLRLPRGRHHLVVRRDGFYDVERDVLVGKNEEIRVELLPRPEYLRDYVESANTVRTWAWVSMGVGTVAMAGGGAYLVWNQGQKDDAKRAFDEQAAIAESEPSGACGTSTCASLVAIRLEKLKDARDRDVWGYAALAAGAAALGTGVVLFATGDDPGRYTPRPQSDVFATLRVDVSPGGASLRGAF